MAARIYELTKQRNDLVSKRNEVVEQANASLRAAQAAADAGKRSLNAEELAADEAFEKRLTEMQAQIDAVEVDLEREGRALARSKGVLREDGTPSPGALPERKAHEKTPSGFKGIGEMLTAVKDSRLHGRTDQRLLATATGAGEAIDSDGGFMVEREYGGTLTSQLFETGVLTSKVRRQPIGEGFNGIKFRIIDEVSRADGSRFGGIQAYWMAEADQLTATKPKFRALELKLNKLIGLMYVTDELLQDAVALQGYVNDWFPQEFGFKLDDAIMNGVGNGIPLGILKSPALVTVAAEGGQTPQTILAKNLEKMYAAMPAWYMPQAEWFINVECWPSLFQMSHPIGTAGVPVFLPAYGIAGAPFGNIFGRPVTPIEQCPGLGLVGDVVFASLPKSYMLIDKGPIQTAASIHVKFLTDEQAFRWVLRVDGQPIPNAPLTPYKTTQSTLLSPFVTLAAR